MASSSFVSSNLQEGHYDPERRELLMVFKSGKAYVYKGVPSQTWNQLLAAESKGSFFGKNIRNAYHAMEYVDGGNPVDWFWHGRDRSLGQLADFRNHLRRDASFPMLAF